MNSTLSLNAAFLRDLSVIAEDETLLAKAVKYIRKLAAKKEDPTLMTKEEFFARVDKSRAQYERREYTRFSNESDMVNWLNSL